MPSQADTVQQWSAETMRALMKRAVEDGLVASPSAEVRDVTLLYGDARGGLPPNAYIRSVGNLLLDPLSGYPVPAGSVLTRLRVYFRNNASSPANTLTLIVVVNGVDAYTLSWQGVAGSPPVAFDVPLSVAVGDATGGLGRVGVRTGVYTLSGNRPSRPLVQITAELP